MGGAEGVSAAKDGGVAAKPARPVKADGFKRALARAAQGHGPSQQAAPFRDEPVHAAWPGPQHGAGAAPDAAFRARIARAETGAARAGEGYGARNAASGALGRDQLTPQALRDLGWRDAGGGWTALAARHGVSSDAELLSGPAAQEAAMGAYLRRAEAQLNSNGSLSRSGGTVTGLDGASVPLTEAASSRPRTGAAPAASRATWRTGAPRPTRRRRFRPRSAGPSPRWNGGCGTSRNCPTRSPPSRPDAAAPARREHGGPAANVLSEQRMKGDVRHCGHAAFLLSFRGSGAEAGERSRFA